MIDWFGRRKEQGISELIAAGEHAKAIELLELKLEAHPQDRRLRLHLADALHRSGDGAEAVRVLSALAADLAQSGRPAQAIVVLKRLLSIEPDHSEVRSRIAELIHRSSESQTDAAVQASEAAVRAGSALVDTPLFEEFSKEELIAVIDGLDRLRHVPGEIVVTEGQPGDSLYVIATGRLLAHVKNKDGRNVQVRELAEGEFFGEISLISGARRSATITAGTDCELLRLGRQKVEEISSSHPGVEGVLRKFCNSRAGNTLESLIRGSSTKADS
jgi:cAMP-dependent protein kinase regulator